MSIYVSKMVESDLDIEIEASDLDWEIVQEWINDHASDEDLAKINFRVDEYHDPSVLEKGYQANVYSLFDVVEFIKNHEEDLKLHNVLFGNKG